MTDVRVMTDELAQISARKMAEMMGQPHSPKPSPKTHAPVELTDRSFDSMIREHHLVVVDCWAAWCYPCRLIAPLIEELAGKYSSVALFAKLNVDENPLTASRYYIQSIPTILIIRNGIEAERVIGAVPKGQIEAALRRHL